MPGPARDQHLVSVSFSSFAPLVIAMVRPGFTNPSSFPAKKSKIRALNDQTEEAPSTAMGPNFYHSGHTSMQNTHTKSRRMTLITPANHPDADGA